MISQQQIQDQARRGKLVEMDQLIRDLEERVDTPQGLMREHLMSLRSDILNSMPLEYESTLALAREILPDIEPAELRRRISEVLGE